MLGVDSLPYRRIRWWTAASGQKPAFSKVLEKLSPPGKGIARLAGVAP